MDSQEAIDEYIERLTGGCPQLSAYVSYARQTERSVVSLLGSLLVKAALCASHQVCIPPKTWQRTDAVVSRDFVPGAIHIGSFVMLCGEPGSGKSDGIRAADHILRNHYVSDPELPFVGQPPSKQGLIQMFALNPSEKAKEDGAAEYRTHAQLENPEGSELGGYTNLEREGGGWNLRAAMREAWTGGTLSSHGAAKERQHLLPGGLYCFAALVGIQPTAVIPALGSTALGDVQRWAMLPVLDWRRRTGDHPEHPPRLELPEEWRRPGGWLILGQDEGVAQEREDHRYWQKGDHTPTEGWEEYWNIIDHGEHSGVLRAKLAASLLILRGLPPVIECRHVAALRSVAGALCDLSARVGGT